MQTHSSNSDDPPSLPLEEVQMLYIKLEVTPCSSVIISLRYDLNYKLSALFVSCYSLMPFYQMKSFFKWIL